MQIDLKKLGVNAHTPVAPYSLAVFRIGFGLLMVYEALRYFLAGWISEYYLEPEFLFTYYGFEWVKPWPGTGLYWHFGLLGLLSLMITLGWRYRLAIWLFLPTFAYVFLLDQARYLNHFYLVGIIAFVLCLVPAHHAWSLDSRRLGQRLVPRWSIWALMALFEIVLLYAGIVKINPDWLAGRPLDRWFADRGNIPLVGSLISGDWAIYAASWGAILLHLLGAPLLFFRKTRLWVFIFYCAFHLTNAVVFTIGIFPWMTIAGTLMFFSPDWPLQIANRLGIRTAGHEVLAPPSPTAFWVVPVLITFLVFQALFPLRHYLYPGDVAWTEEGHRFAWRMKLRGKSGHTRYYLLDPATGKQWVVNPEQYLSRRQYRYLVGRPDMIQQFAYFLERKWQREKSLGDLEVRVSAWCSLNGYPQRLLIDPEIDLTSRKRVLWPAADWILPRPSF